MGFETIETEFIEVVIVADDRPSPRLNLGNGREKGVDKFDVVFLIELEGERGVEAIRPKDTTEVADTIETVSDLLLGEFVVGIEGPGDFGQNEVATSSLKTIGFDGLEKIDTGLVWGGGVFD